RTARTSRGRRRGGCGPYVHRWPDQELDGGPAGARKLQFRLIRARLVAARVTKVGRDASGRHQFSQGESYVQKNRPATRRRRQSSEYSARWNDIGGGVGPVGSKAEHPCHIR